jgi:activator of HSP90 ATPase
MNRVTIGLVQHFNTTAADVYAILMDERKHSSFTGDVVEIAEIENTSFSLMGGLAYGKNVMLEKESKVMWSFAMAHPEWPENHWSEVIILLKPGPEKGCTLTLSHTEIPEHLEELMKQFWEENYWNALSYYIDR